MTSSTIGGKRTADGTQNTPKHALASRSGKNFQTVYTMDTLPSSYARWHQTYQAWSSPGSPTCYQTRKHWRRSSAKPYRDGTAAMAYPSQGTKHGDDHFHPTAARTTPATRLNTLNIHMLKALQERPPGITPTQFPCCFVGCANFSSLSRRVSLDLDDPLFVLLRHALHGPTSA